MSFLCHSEQANTSLFLLYCIKVKIQVYKKWIQIHFLFLLVFLKKGHAVRLSLLVFSLH